MAAWIGESRKLAEQVAYDPMILAAVQQPGELAPINLPKSYLTEGGRHARLRVVAAGLRLAALLEQQTQAGRSCATCRRPIRRIIRSSIATLGIGVGRDGLLAQRQRQRPTQLNMPLVSEYEARAHVHG